ncbi:MAG: hypothetical protein GY723_18690 [bacterium]|nr:hypothetical protein [bacterium]MCP5066451.1 hypothetical protein [bacterium]
MNAHIGDLPFEAVDLRAALLELTDPLEVIARDILGCGGHIGWIVRDPTGRVGLVQRALPGRDLEAWAELVAQLAWLAPRLADWHQLAPERRLDPSLSPRALLVADSFEERTRLAAASSGCRVELWRLALAPSGASLIPEGQRALQAAPPADMFLVDNPPKRSHFRSRLRDEDL